MKTLSALVNDLFTDRTNKDIKHILNWIFNKRNPYSNALIDLFENFIQEGFLLNDNKAKPNELSYFQNIIELSRRDIPINWTEFPVIEDNNVKRKLFRWLRNVSRDDLGFLPDNPYQIIPFNIICSNDTFRLIEYNYKGMGYKDSLQWLNGFIDNYRFSQLGELLPFTVGPCIIMCNELLASEDIVLLPRIMNQFFHNNQLGVVIIPDIKLVIVRKNILKNSYLPIVQPISFKEIILLANSLGWEVLKIRIKY